MNMLEFSYIQTYEFTENYCKYGLQNGFFVERGRTRRRKNLHAGGSGSFETGNCTIQLG